MGKHGHWNHAMSPNWSCGWNCALGKDSQPLTICGPAWRGHLPMSRQCLALAKPYQKSKGKEVGSRQATEVSLMDRGQIEEEWRRELKGHRKISISLCPLIPTGWWGLRKLELYKFPLLPHSHPQTLSGQGWLCLRSHSEHYSEHRAYSQRLRFKSQLYHFISFLRLPLQLTTNWVA